MWKSILQTSLGRSDALRFIGVILASIAALVTEADHSEADGIRTVLSRDLEDEIRHYSMDISSDGRIFVAAESDSDFGSVIFVLYSEDDGDTWTILNVLSSVDPNNYLRHPSIHVAEGDEDRLFLSYVAGTAFGDPPDFGYTDSAVHVVYRPLDDLLVPWSTWTVYESEWGGAMELTLTSDAHLRSDYGVFLMFSSTGGEYQVVYFSRSLDQGTTWEDAQLVISHEWIAFYNYGEFVVMPDRTLVAAMNMVGRLAIYRSSNAGEGIWTRDDWVSEYPPNVARWKPSIVHWPGTETLFAAHCTQFEDFWIYRSDDAGLTWSAPEEASILVHDRATLEVAPTGFRSAGVDDQGHHTFFEPDGIDPLGPWSSRTIHDQEDTEGWEMPQATSNPAKDDLWCTLSLGDNNTLLFYAEWLDVPAATETMTRLNRSRLRVQPNPTMDAVSLVLPPSDSELLPGSFEVRDVGGRLVYRSPRHESVNGTSWDLRNDLGQRVPSGVYFLSLTGSDAEFARIVVR